MCATSWCDLDLTFDLAYLMLFNVSTKISDTIYLSYIISLISFYLNLTWILNETKCGVPVYRSHHYCELIATNLS